MGEAEVGRVADLRLVLLPVRSHAVMQSYALMRRIFAQTRITAWIWTDQNGSKGQAADRSGRAAGSGTRHARHRTFEAAGEEYQVAQAHEDPAHAYDESGHIQVRPQPDGQ